MCPKGETLRKRVENRLDSYVGESSAAGQAFDSGFVNREAPGELRHLLPHALFRDGIADMPQYLGDPFADLLHFRFVHATRGYRRAAQADSPGFHWRQRVKRNSVLVYGDARAVQSFFRIATGQAARMKLDQKKMVVRSSGHDAESLLRHRACHGL